jgi:hypothetical protein
MENKIYDERNINRERHDNLRKSTDKHKEEIYESCGECDKLKMLLNILEKKEEEEENVITDKDNDTKTSALKREEKVEEVGENLIKSFIMKKGLEAINNKYIIINPFSEEDKKFIRLVSKFSHVIPTKIQINENEDPIDVFELKIIWDKADKKMQKFKKTPKRYRFLIIPTHLSLLFYGNLSKEEIQEAKKIIKKTEEGIVKEDLNKEAGNRMGEVLTMTSFALAPFVLPIIARKMTPPPDRIPLSWWQRIKQSIYDKYERWKTKFEGNNEFIKRFIESSAWHKFIDKHFNVRKKLYSEKIATNLGILYAGFNLAQTIYALSKQEEPIDIRGAIATETQLYKGGSFAEIWKTIKDTAGQSLESIHSGLSAAIPEQYLSLYHYYDNIISPTVELYKTKKMEEKIREIPFHKKIFLRLLGIIFYGTPRLKKIGDKLIETDIEKAKHQLKTLSATLTLLYKNRKNFFAKKRLAESSYIGYVKNVGSQIEQTVN